MIKQLLKYKIPNNYLQTMTYCDESYNDRIYNLTFNDNLNLLSNLPENLLHGDILNNLVSGVAFHQYITTYKLTDNIIHILDSYYFPINKISYGIFY